MNAAFSFAPLIAFDLCINGPLISHLLVVKWPSRNKETRDASVDSSNYSLMRMIFSCRTITRVLGLDDNGLYWIGLNDRMSDGNWRWVNGHRASANDVTLWRPNEPDGGEIQNCGRAFFSNRNINAFLAFDVECTALHTRAVCEKII